MQNSTHRHIPNCSFALSSRKTAADEHHHRNQSTLDVIKYNYADTASNKPISVTLNNTALLLRLLKMSDYDLTTGRLHSHLSDRCGQKLVITSELIWVNFHIRTIEQGTYLSNTDISQPIWCGEKKDSVFANLDAFKSYQHHNQDTQTRDKQYQIQIELLWWDKITKHQKYMRLSSHPVRYVHSMVIS